jgi:hypothetical protein
MEQDRISRTQLAALIWAGVLAPVTALLPALTLPAAGKGAWLAPVAALPLVLLSGWLLGSLSGERGLAETLRRELGPVAGGGLLLLYIIWGELLLAIRLQQGARRLFSAGERDGSLWFFLLGIAALALWMGRGRLAAFARAGQVFLAVLLTAGAVVVLFSLPQVRLERVLPLWRADWVSVLRSGIPAAGVLGWGLYGAFLVGRTAPAEEMRWAHGLFWGVSGCLLVALLQWVILGELGAALAGLLADPFFSLAQSVGMEGYFQRVESVIAALWTLADLSMAVLLLFALRELVAALWPKVEARWAATVALLLAVVLAALLGEQGEEWDRGVVPMGNLLLGLAVPLLVMVWRLWKKRRKRGISCGGDMH